MIAKRGKRAEKRERSKRYMLKKDEEQLANLTFLMTNKLSDPTDYEWEHIECKNTENHLSKVVNYQLCSLHLFCSDLELEGDPMDVMEVWRRANSDTPRCHGIMYRSDIITQLTRSVKSLDELNDCRWRRTDETTLYVFYLHMKILPTKTIIFYNSDRMTAALTQFKINKEFGAGNSDYVWNLLIDSARMYTLRGMSLLTVHLKPGMLHEIDTTPRRWLVSATNSPESKVVPEKAIIPAGSIDTGAVWENLPCLNDTRPHSYMCNLQGEAKSHYLNNVLIDGRPDELMELWYQGNISAVVTRDHIAKHINYNDKTKCLNDVNKWRFRAIPESHVYILYTCCSRKIFYHKAEADKIEARLTGLTHCVTIKTL